VLGPSCGAEFIFEPVQCAVRNGLITRDGDANLGGATDIQNRQLVQRFHLPLCRRGVEMGTLLSIKRRWFARQYSPDEYTRDLSVNHGYRRVFADSIVGLEYSADIQNEQ